MVENKTANIDRATDVAARLNRNLIDGQWVASESGRSIPVHNPARGDAIGQVPESGASDVEAAVAAARQSFDTKAWTGLAATERAKILWRVGDLIEAEADAIAHLETLDVGMPLAKSRGLVQTSAEKFRYAAGWCTKIHGETTDLHFPMGTFQSYTLKEAVGVAALITPWNVPLALASTKLASALAAGCSVVLKPAEETPLSATRLGEILIEAGVPAGVVNIVHGVGSVAGAALAEHADVDKISFTGSTAVGKRIGAAALGNMKRVSLELGGKSPVVVFEDADLAAAAPFIANGVFSNSGQICVAGSRIFVHRSRHDELIERLAGIASRMNVGDGFDPETHLGPIVSQRQIDRVAELVESGIADGSSLAAGGMRIGDRGYFYAPTILTAPRPGARILRDEIFGPVANVLPFDDEEEVVAMANDTEYGLAAAAYTNDARRAHRIARRLRAGTVWLNTQLVMDPSVPFGGYRQSGWGRESGREGIEAYLETKSVFAAM